MKTRAIPEVIYREGQPVAVILDIDAYEELLARLEDQEDLQELKRIRKQPLEFQSLDAVLSELDIDV